MWCKVCLRHLATKLNTHDSCAQQCAVCEALTASEEHRKKYPPFVRPSLNNFSQLRSATSCFVKTEKNACAVISSLFGLTVIHPCCVFTR